MTPRFELIEEKRRITVTSLSVKIDDKKFDLNELKSLLSQLEHTSVSGNKVFIQNADLRNMLEHHNVIDTLIVNLASYKARNYSNFSKLLSKFLTKELKKK
jgi:hypothetical protein